MSSGGSFNETPETVLVSLGRSMDMGGKKSMNPIDDEETPVTCGACGGLGWRDVGDCEDGNITTCLACDGTGKELYEPTNY